MEGISLLSPGSGHKQNTSRKTGGVLGCDIWAAVRSDTVQEVEHALTLLKRSNVNIDARNAYGSTVLHIAAWRNHIPIVRRLLAAGANPDARDGESGWSSLHRALHFGHLAVAGVLIEAGASLSLEDTKGRTPIDLLSGPVKSAIANPQNSGAAEVYSWGNGANYQLGTGTAGIQRIPCRIDALQSLDVIHIAAAKFHSAAVTANGDVYTWGFGRGGRLGHPDFDIHSGQVAVISPRQVISGLVGKRVKVISVAKHHTIIATDGGEVFTWGSNRDGRLGYPAIDTQPTPRKVSTLKARVVAVAGANKHSVVLTENGEVYTWGCNREGQLGYGTSNSASNFTPRLIDYLKGRHMVAVSTAKYHTVVLGAEGEVMTWGYKMVNPRRVLVLRDTKKRGPVPLKYHRADKLHVIAIAAGMTHSTAVTEDGLVFYWISSDPHLRPHQLSSMASHQAVAVAAGKFRTAVATSTGSVYAWDGEGSKADVAPSPVRVHGVKHAVGLSVGETHSLAVAALYMPTYSTKPVDETLAVTRLAPEGEEPMDEEAELEEDTESPGPVKANRLDEGVPSLKDLCQKVAAESIVEPKNTLQMLEFADSLGADHLRRFCEDSVLRNLDYILTISPTTFAQLQPSLLAELEKVLDSRSNQPWSHRLLPTPSATIPAVIDSEEDDSDVCGNPRSRGFSWLEGGNNLTVRKPSTEDYFLSGNGREDDAVGKQLRAVRKKLQQIEALELKQFKGQALDSQQLAKLETKHELEEALSLLESGILPPTVLQSSKVKNSPGLIRGKSSVGEAGGDTDLKHGPRTGRRKSKGLASRGQGNSAPAPAVSKETRSYEDFDLQDTLLQIVQLESQSNIAEASPSVPCETSSIPEPPLSTQNDVPPSPISFREISGFAAQNLGDAAESWSNTQALRSSKKKAKKGGLSMFLSGALEAPPKAQTPPPLPKVEGPAWGGKHMPKGAASLKEIQTQQTEEVTISKNGVVSLVETGSAIRSSVVGIPTTNERPSLGVSVKEMGSGKIGSSGKTSAGRIPPDVTSIKSRSLPGASSIVKSSVVGFNSSRPSVGVASSSSSSRFEPADSTSEEMMEGVLRVPLSEFVRSSAPIAVTQSKSSNGLHPENSPPAWAGRSPGTSAPSLRDIQLQQVKQHKAQQRPLPSRGSPQVTSPVSLMTSAPGSSIQTADHASPSTEPPSRWFKPETVNPSPLRCIQKEEQAMKELRRLYTNVRIARQVDS